VHPAKAVGGKEMPFGRDSRVVRNNTALDRGLVPTGKGGFEGRCPQSKFALQIVVKLLKIAEWLL